MITSLNDYWQVAKGHMTSIKKKSVVGSLLDLDGEGAGDLDRIDSRGILFSDDKSMNRRLTSSSSGYSSSRPGQRFSQVGGFDFIKYRSLLFLLCRS